MEVQGCSAGARPSFGKIPGLLGCELCSMGFFSGSIVFSYIRQEAKGWVVVGWNLVVIELSMLSFYRLGWAVAVWRRNWTMYIRGCTYEGADKLG